MRRGRFFCPNVANVAMPPCGLEGVNMGFREDMAVEQSDEHADVAFLGGGPGGYLAALTAARRASVVRGSARLSGANTLTAVLNAALGLRDATIHMHSR